MRPAEIILKRLFSHSLSSNTESNTIIKKVLHWSENFHWAPIAVITWRLLWCNETPVRLIRVLRMFVTRCAEFVHPGDLMRSKVTTTCEVITSLMVHSGDPHVTRLSRCWCLARRAPMKKSQALMLRSCHVIISVVCFHLNFRAVCNKRFHYIWLGTWTPHVKDRRSWCVHTCDSQGVTIACRGEICIKVWQSWTPEFAHKFVSHEWLKFNPNLTDVVLFIHTTEPRTTVWNSKSNHNHSWT